MTATFQRLTGVAQLPTRMIRFDLAQFLGDGDESERLDNLAQLHASIINNPATREAGVSNLLNIPEMAKSPATSEEMSPHYYLLLPNLLAISIPADNEHRENIVKAVAQAGMGSEEHKLELLYLTNREPVLMDEANLNIEWSSLLSLVDLLNEGDASPPYLGLLVETMIGGTYRVWPVATPTFIQSVFEPLHRYPSVDACTKLFSEWQRKIENIFGDGLDSSRHWIGWANEYIERLTGVYRSIRERASSTNSTLPGPRTSRMSFSQTHQPSAEPLEQYQAKAQAIVVRGEHTPVESWKVPNLDVLHDRTQYEMPGWAFKALLRGLLDGRQVATTSSGRPASFARNEPFTLTSPRDARPEQMVLFGDGSVRWFTDEQFNDLFAASEPASEEESATDDAGVEQVAGEEEQQAAADTQSSASKEDDAPSVE